MLEIARRHLRALDSQLGDAPIHLRQLDGPPDAPRYAVSVNACFRIGDCPQGISPSEEDRCPVLECELRHSLRLLLDRDGNLIQVIRGGLRWD